MKVKVDYLKRLTKLINLYPCNPIKWRSHKLTLEMKEVHYHQYYGHKKW